MSPSIAATGSSVRVFLSYASQDQDLATKLQKTVERDHIDCFFAPDIHRQQFWQPELETKIRNAHLLLLLYTKAASESKWVEWEVKQAAKCGINIWVVMDQHVPLTPFFAEQPFMARHQYFLREGNHADPFADVRKDLDDLFPKAIRSYRGSVTPENCPYPGVKTFDENDPRYPFFPPRIAVNQMLLALGGHRPAPILLMSGPSGAGKSSLLRAGLRRHIPDAHLQRPIEATAKSTPKELVSEALYRLRAAQPALQDQPLTDDISGDLANAIERAEGNQFVFSFDQMENFFTGNRTRDEIQYFLERLKDVRQLTPVKKVTFIISFRKESLMEVERYVEEHFRNDCRKVFIFKMSCDDARTSIIGPCEDRDLYFDRDFADALVKGLQEGGHEAEPIVNPMDIQKVCKELWLGLSKQPHHHRIDANALDDFIDHDQAYRGRLAGVSQGDRVRKFIEVVLSDFLRKAIVEIAAGMGKDTTYVWASLYSVFVGPSGERLRWKVELRNNNKFVGRLQIDHINVLVDNGLVQNCGNDEFELVHDSLAEQIAREGGTIAEVVATKNLMELKERSPAGGSFNQHTELLEKLEALRATDYEFDADEAVFVVGCALGDKRQSMAKAPIPLKEWAKLAANSPKHLLMVLTEGLGREESVQLDVLELAQGELLNRNELQAETTEFEELKRRIRNLSLTALGDVQARACSALVALDDSEGIHAVFAAYRRSEEGATRALAQIRNGIDTLCRYNCESWREEWKSLHSPQEFAILARLCLSRLRHAYAWIGLIVAITAPVTAIGAILPFIPLGAAGASLTLEDTDFGMFAGIFHGATGGLVWGVGVTIGLLTYAVIWRGGRIRRQFRETLGLSIFAMFGAALGGLANAAVIVYAFSPEGLFRGGWLDPRIQVMKDLTPRLVLSSGGRSYQAFLYTRHGWIMPIFGAALGVGIGWALATILSDPRERWLRRDAEGRIHLAPGNLGAAFRRIFLVVMQNSWRNLVWLFIGSLIILRILIPGAGVCDPAFRRPDLSKDQSTIYSLEQCEEPYLMPDIRVRTTGLALIILGGSLFQEMGFLCTLLFLQFGVEVRRRVKENDTFLRSAGAALAT
jgi:hypothetical protein